MTVVKLINAKLDDAGDGKNVVLRGRLVMETLPNILFDDYQREFMTSTRDIRRALEAGTRLPDVELGMRGDNFDQRGDTVFLRDPVYAIDGRQRIQTTLAYAADHAGFDMAPGAVVNLNTTKEWEAERFDKLNTKRIRVAPSVLLRNTRDQNIGLAQIYGLSMSDKSFALYQRVAWDQRMKRGEITTGMNIAKVALTLHSHIQRGSDIQTGMREMSGDLSTVCKAVGTARFRANIWTFFDLIDRCYGLRSIQFRGPAPQIKLVFLGVIAKFLSMHSDFWAGDDQRRLVVSALQARKIASLPINDPQIAALSGASGKAPTMLLQIVIDHYNSGKRTKRLAPRRMVNGSGEHHVAA